MMFSFGKNKSPRPPSGKDEQPGEGNKTGLFGRLKAGLSKTRSGLTQGIANLVKDIAVAMHPEVAELDNVVRPEG